MTVFPHPSWLETEESINFVRAVATAQEGVWVETQFLGRRNPEAHQLDDALGNDPDWDVERDGVPARLYMKVVSRKIDQKSGSVVLELVGVDCYRGTELAYQNAVARAASVQASREMAHETSKLREMAGTLPGRLLWTATATAIDTSVDSAEIQSMIINRCRETERERV